MYISAKARQSLSTVDKLAFSHEARFWRMHKAYKRRVLPRFYVTTTPPKEIALENESSDFVSRNAYVSISLQKSVIASETKLKKIKRLIAAA